MRVDCPKLFLKPWFRQPRLFFMNIVTDLTTQKRNKERLNVFIDGRYAFSLALETAVGLKIGQSLSDEAIANLKTADTYYQAKNQAVRLLSYRPRSVQEVTQDRKSVV